MKRIEIDTSSIQVMGGGRPGGRPPATGIGAVLRRFRFRAALVIAAAELIAMIAIGKPAMWLLAAVALAAIFTHFTLARNGAPYAVRQVTWTLAFAQALVALFPVAFGIATLAIIVMLVGFVLIGLMLMLGDRS